MANLRNTAAAPAAARSGETVQEVRDRWSGEISTTDYPPVWNDAGTQMGSRSGMVPPVGGMNGNGGQTSGMQMRSNSGLQMSRPGQMQQTDGLDMHHMLPSEVVESPTTMNEAYLGSLKAMLVQNKGNYIVATFLVGTQGTVSWEGILYEVGNDYVTIYQPGRDRYIVSDIYSLRYMEFYDTQRRELCDRLMQNQNRQNGSW